MIEVSSSYSINFVNEKNYMQFSQLLPYRVYFKSELVIIIKETYNVWHNWFLSKDHQHLISKKKSIDECMKLTKVSNNRGGR